MKTVLQMSPDLKMKAIWLFGYTKRQQLFTMQQGAISRGLNIQNISC